MALSLDKPSAKLAIDLQGSQPSVHVGSKSILVCCSETKINKASADTDNTSVKSTTGHAVTVTGTVFLAAGENDFDIGDWQFGMVQVAQLYGYRFRYAGKTDAAGSIAVDRLGAFTKNPCLDVEPETGESIDDHIFSILNMEAPLVKTPSRGFNVKVTFGDHPNNFMPLALENRVTGAQNFIASAYRNEAFITYFVARASATSPLICLGRVGWHFVMAADFKWKTGTAKPTRRITEQLIYAGSVLLGAPPDDDSHFVVARTRATPTTNKQDEDAAEGVLLRREKVAKQETSRPADLPSDFFT